MNSLQTLRRLKDKITQCQQLDNHSYTNYKIPSCWRSITPPFSILTINPYDFYLGAIERILSMPVHTSSTTKHSSEGIYALFVRVGLAFDHQEIAPAITTKGTFLKAIAALPLYQSIGIQTIVLLPIFAHAKNVKKGDVGSPYATIDWHQIEPDLFDPIAGDESTVEEQFQAFVEAAHHLGIQIFIDYAPRTCSRESQLILAHPEWFYWIQTQDLPLYSAPKIPSLPPFTLATSKVSKQLYKSKEVVSFINQFCLDPFTQFPDKWSEFVKKHAKENNPLSSIKATFKLTIAPAFADVINDPQPAWNDITYLRFYHDHPCSSPRQFHGNPPYLLYDVAKASLNPGKRPNRYLWQYLSNVLPRMIQQYKIDGARIDMGHALPKELSDLIIHKAREINPNFIFLSEEMNPDHLAKAKNQGYNLSLGQSFFMMHEIESFSLHEWAYGTSKLALPTIAACETHDTPRISARCSEDVATFLLALSHFIPHTVSWINGGQELGEMNPMNQGLGFSTPIQDAAKLALFDEVIYNYNRPVFATNVDLLQRIHSVKQLYPNMFNQKEAQPLGFLHMREPAIGFLYHWTRYESLFLVAHTSPHHGRVHLRLQEALSQSTIDLSTIKCVFSSKGSTPSITQISSELLAFDCEPYQVSIFHLLHSQP